LKKALITGVEGFVGEYLAQELLKNGYEVIGTRLADISKSLEEKIKVFKLDILDKEKLKLVIEKERPQYIFHLAAISSAKYSWQNPQKTMNININGTLNLLDIARESNFDIRIILIGSAEEYGQVMPEEIPIKETNLPRPQNPYSVSKLAQTLLAKQYEKAYSMDIVIMRAFNHIGPKQSEIFVVSDFAKQIAEIERGLREPVIKVGNLKAKRDFTDVRDIVKGYVAAAERGRSGEIYNIGSSRAIAIEDILYKLIELSDNKNSIEVIIDKDKFRPIDAPILLGDCSKLEQHTSWSRTIDLEETLKDVLDYWRGKID